MALLGIPEGDRILEYECIDLLPGLENDVLFADAVIPDIEESFVSGIEDWWGDFISDICL